MSSGVSSSAVLAPTCVFAPTTADQVSFLVKTAVANSCKFAAKGGGHSAVPGAADVDNGILISFDNMKNISLQTASDGTKYAAVQPGLHWGDVYTYLDPLNVIPAVGRFYPVGTGLVLGAGFSFLGNEKGFATDSVYSFETVLANGSIVTVSQTNAPDLFKAMKGGGNNFAIVTRYNLRVFPGGKIAGGMVIAAEDQTEKWLDLTYDYATVQAVQEVKSHALPAMAWVQATDVAISETPVVYVVPGATQLPAIMSGWNNMTAISNTVRSVYPHELAQEYAAGFSNGQFQEQRVFTIKANRAEFAYIWYQFLAWARAMKDVPGFNILHCNMPVTPRMATAGLAYGGNSLGLDSNKDVLSVIYLGITMDTRDDSVVSSFRSLFTTLQSHSKSANLLHPWLFWNYAGIGQDVIASYGTASVANMKKVRTKYDPSGVFKTLVPGGFKLA
ncbi:FAD-binding domain-containing protein [Paraphaeosphaeria sporulosa]|uniref:FAD-binding domain-containing protein n=1 Tax=Paraphaeosphaeria sporulosa TaxID=1460663 RepID=A0A177BXV0_9PLEO|nr:FAD-binding domain-containing protein [Paraphaeosphaeria sporulosa]OAF99159.1 FAD-binding domain-containing protein [Paraphaeosphaeria sporulosa]